MNPWANVARRAARARVRAWVVVATVLMAVAPWARGEMKISLDVGWGERLRAGCWTPVFVTVSDDRPRNVVLELDVPHDTIHAMRIRQGVAVGPTAVTYSLLAPLNLPLEEAVVVVREAESDRELGRQSLADSGGRDVERVVMSHPRAAFMGISGAESSARVLRGQFQQAGLEADYLPQERLPAVAMGYEGLDVLVLNRPDMTHLGLDQQQAIVNWVRAGGSLVLWAAADPFAVAGPLVKELPCRIGEARTVMIPPRELTAAGLGERFGRMGGRELVPSDDAQRVELFGRSGVVGYRRRAGMGQILVLPVDVAPFLFRAPENAGHFWRPLLEPLAELPPVGGDSSQRSQYAYAIGDSRSIARQQSMDYLGNIPGVGRLEFSAIALVMLAMMLLVGPVDWFVLKMLRRQPWTWVTTSGWAGFVTIGALYMGSVIKSGDLHYRTLRVVDQADGATVATLDFVCIYSPRTAWYTVKAWPDSWWQPVGYMPYYSRSTYRSDIGFGQNYRGNTPEAQRVNIWNLRFLEGESEEAGPAAMDASLVRQRDSLDSMDHIVGTITNRSSAAMRQIVLRTGSGICRLSETLAPGATIKVNAVVHADDVWNPKREQQYRGSYATPAPESEAGGIDYAYKGDLAMSRSKAIDRLVGQGEEYVCIYAKMDAVAAAVPIEAENAKERHEVIVRAVLPLGR
jgi:hypothetical protein